MVPGSRKRLLIPQCDIIRGFQGVRLGKHSVACMTKHFPGGGPQKDGEDPHFPFGYGLSY